MKHTNTQRLEDIEKYIHSLQEYIEENNFAGWDPYDAMNSPLLRLLSLGTEYGRIVCTQFMRRCPLNFRKMLLIPKGHNPKSLGLLLSAYSWLYSISKEKHILAKIDEFVKLLDKYKSPGYSGYCWGYNFDWQSRAAFVRKYTPTLVNSSFIGHALLDAYETLENRNALKMADSIKDFILQDLNRKKEGDTFCFSYTPADNNYVHNANMLGASFLIRLSKITKNASLREPAFASLGYSMKYQHEDGSWYYAETSFQKWIDSFHTGFNLEALKYFLEDKKGFTYSDSYKKGVEYYAYNFFLKDGTPKYYYNKVYPIDIHSSAVAISLFSTEPEYRNLAAHILEWTLNNMYDGKKATFYFRRYRHFKATIPYMRWGQAWMFYALVRYYLNME